MYVTNDMLRSIEQAYGRPSHREFIVPSSAEELTRIAASQRDGRNHDVTLYIRKGEQVVVIAKHFYPPGLYRAPSGGIHLGEDFQAGVAREVAEECGCEIGLKRFLLRTSVRFHADNTEGASSAGEDNHNSNVHSILWRSFVFLADYIAGDFQFTDRREIREVRLADWGEFEIFGRMMRQYGRGGFMYRAALHEAVAELADGWPFR